jgi:hypothetical protein
MIKRSRQDDFGETSNNLSHRLGQYTSIFTQMNFKMETLRRNLNKPGFSLKASAASCSRTGFVSTGASVEGLGRNRRFGGWAASPSTSGCSLTSGLGAEGLK